MKDKIALIIFGVSQIITKVRVQLFLTVVWILGLMQLPYFTYWFFSGVVLYIAYLIDGMSYHLFSDKAMEFHMYEFIIGFNLFAVLGPIMIPIGILYYIHSD